MGTTSVTVELTVGGNPEVTLDVNGNAVRTITSTKGGTVKFQRKGGSTFTVTGFDPLGAGTAFDDKKTGGSGQWLSVDVAANNSTPPVDHPFTLTVTGGDGTTKHTTTQTETTPDNGRPVIRN